MLVHLIDYSFTINSSLTKSIAKEVLGFFWRLSLFQNVHNLKLIVRVLLLIFSRLLPASLFCHFVCVKKQSRTFRFQEKYPSDTAAYVVHCVSKDRTSKTDWHNFVKIRTLWMIFHRMHQVSGVRFFETQCSICCCDTLNPYTADAIPSRTHFSTGRLKSWEWTTPHGQKAGGENVGVVKSARRNRSRQRRTERSWKIMYYWHNPYMLKIVACLS